MFIWRKKRMKVLKAVALLAVGFSFIGSGWCETPDQIEGLCKKENNPGPCQQSRDTRGKCNWSNGCHAKCDQFKNQNECVALKINGKNHCKWLAAGNQGMCKPN